MTLIIQIALAVLALRFAFKEGNVLQWWPLLFEEWIWEPLKKPLYDCTPCMSSVWGIPLILLAGVKGWAILFIWLGAAGLLVIIEIILNKLTDGEWSD